MDLRNEFKISLRLARKLLSEIRSLARLFADTHLAGVSLDFLPLGEQFPNVTVDFKTWLGLSASSRLHSLSGTLSHFQSKLRDLKVPERGRGGPFRRRLRVADLDLRDLQRHLHFQMRMMGPESPVEKDDEEKGLLRRLRPTPPPPKSSWLRMIQTYQLLHSLELVLARGVRDLLLLSWGHKPPGT
ncbi:LOW QUALITY PROTEIN: interleukin-27 subunit alpha [Tachyglossus aculeatus]|uniref:LOW QUALITY PROTEIN: interleukin-27 subunit alpha n=1 Tax=Tachyglossus aculeatus TaxID=9261 RepID=UPI0018F3C841|nr:LOW QUALITY PROTEIN: interleukin-27 subunit alpha [Tachyglossus aculeatus]